MTVSHDLHVLDLADGVGLGHGLGWGQGGQCSVCVARSISSAEGEFLCVRSVPPPSKRPFLPPTKQRAGIFVVVSISKVCS